MSKAATTLATMISFSLSHMCNDFRITLDLYNMYLKKGKPLINISKYFAKKILNLNTDKYKSVLICENL